MGYLIRSLLLACVLLPVWAGKNWDKWSTFGGGGCVINRGGEKITPREIDEVLMDHPAIAQALAFAMPHDKLGEEVAAAVVLREGETATERELRDFVAGRLADFKVPRRIVVLAEIPKGPTGKLQRIGLAAKLGLTA
jgi:acyl-CoA synthetase (AMP-forming)/AMP-acid ligase II